MFHNIMAGQPTVNKPLIRPYFWGGHVWGGWLTSHDNILGDFFVVFFHSFRGDIAVLLIASGRSVSSLKQSLKSGSSADDTKLENKV